MADFIGIIIQLGSFLLLLGLGYFVGSYREKKHFASIERREKELAHITQCNLKTFPKDWNVTSAELVVGNVVIANDYFKVIASSLRNLFGGHINSLALLVERARREAALRMLQKAHKKGAQAIWNIRIETSTITSGRRSAAGVEVVAYGTALQINKNTPPDKPPHEA